MNPPSAVTLEKQQIRQTMRARLRTIPAVERAERAQQAVKLLQTHPLWRQARSILGYLALKDELDLWGALTEAQSQEKVVAIPRYLPEAQGYGAAVLPREPSELREAGFGILEPPADAPLVPLNRLDFVLAPGLAFDLRGRRLGRGKGYYDRLLAQVRGIKCGVALDEQIVEALPEENHDIAMNLILTPTRWLVVSPAGT